MCDIYVLHNQVFQFMQKLSELLANKSKQALCHQPNEYKMTHISASKCYKELLWYFCYAINLMNIK